ncbi:hypothetical protein [Arcanobacterium ihumii]|uniref:hypothetical protein n=1 Tax=Arcanobacterium ihumii TaxID=2138162 RepID=UPI00190F2277|nr:hypothetical protein [Arcanobacterium ihumii]
MENTQEVKNGCGCGSHGHGGHGHGHSRGHGGCGGGNCGCGGRGKRPGVVTEATPKNAPQDISGGRTQLGLRGK